MSSTILKNIKNIDHERNFHNEVKKKKEDIDIYPWMNFKRNSAGKIVYQGKEKWIWIPFLKPFTRVNYSHMKLFDWKTVDKYL